MNTRLALPLLAALCLLIAACSSAGAASPSQSRPAPTPTPIAADVTTPEEAAALVIATDPRFAGTIKLNPDLIGASQWWEAAPLDDGFKITLTIGWGDCPAGCINRHTWVYQVTADGGVTLLEESGDPMPAGILPNG